MLRLATLALALLAPGCGAATAPPATATTTTTTTTATSTAGPPADLSAEAVEDVVLRYYALRTGADGELAGVMAPRLECLFGDAEVAPAIGEVETRAVLDELIVGEVGARRAEAIAWLADFDRDPAMWAERLRVESAPSGVRIVSVERADRSCSPFAEPAPPGRLAGCAAARSECEEPDGSGDLTCAEHGHRCLGTGAPDRAPPAARPRLEVASSECDGCWCTVFPPSAPPSMWSAAGSDASRLFGLGRSLWSFDGESWTLQRIDDAPAGVALATLDDGTVILLGDGTAHAARPGEHTFAPEPALGAAHVLHAAAGPSGRDYHVVGARGLALRRTASGWERIPAPCGGSLRLVERRSDGLYVYGRDRSVYRYRAGLWSRDRSGGDPITRALVPQSVNLRYVDRDGRLWTPEGDDVVRTDPDGVATRIPLPEIGHLRAVHGVGGAPLLVVGEGGAAVADASERGLRTFGRGARFFVDAVSTDGARLLASGPRGVVAISPDGRAEPIPLPDAPVGHVVGCGGSIVGSGHRFRDGRWTAFPEALRGAELSCDADGVWARRSGTNHRLGEAGWEPLPRFPDGVFTGVRLSGEFVGPRCRAGRCELVAGTRERERVLRAIEGELPRLSSDGRWLVAVTSAQTLVYEGGRWTERPGVPLAHVRQVAGLGPRDVYALGGDDPAELVILAHFDGERWTRERLPPGLGGHLAVGSDGSVWISATERTAVCRRPAAAR